MAKEIKAEIVINASPEKIWNPFIKSIKGEVKVGNKITVRIEPPNAKGMTFKPKVLTYETNKQLSWLGQLFFTGVFENINLNSLTTETGQQPLRKVKI